MLPCLIKDDDMKQFKKLTAALLAAVMLSSLAGCGWFGSSEQTSVSDDATSDEGKMVPKSTAVENSPNVNGKRFNMTLTQFSDAYNAEKSRRKEKDMITVNKWQKSGKTEKDDNGVEVQYWHYNEKDLTFTASVEVLTDKIINIGCGTAVSTFMGMDGTQSNSDAILDKAALMAEIVCGFRRGYEDELHDIFYHTTTDKEDTLWFRGYVFNRSTKEDAADKKNNIMLFRVFPVTDELKKEWNLKEYQFTLNSNKK